MCEIGRKKGEGIVREMRKMFDEIGIGKRRNGNVGKESERAK
jgi:hypothetical protein